VGALRLWSADETTTRAIGAAVAGLLGPGDVVGLAGDLGAGKTRLVQGAAEALGADGPVLSPTFMLVREYDGDPPVHHVDAYRLSGPSELEDLGLEDVLSPDAVVFVEWADRVAAALPESWLELVLHIRDDDRRELDVRPHGPDWTARAGRLAAALEPFLRRPRTARETTELS
jgi:tRNA threonylcarbamoyladenosine biosynthesis protein TsaE